MSCKREKCADCNGRNSPPVRPPGDKNATETEVRRFEFGGCFIRYVDSEKELLGSGVTSVLVSLFGVVDFFVLAFFSMKHRESDRDPTSPSSLEEEHQTLGTSIT